MVVCEGAGGSGELIFKDGWEEWWVKCPVCGTTWMGGSGENLPEHKDIRAPRSQPAQPPPDPHRDARRAEAKRLADGRSRAQGIGIRFGDYLEMLGILNELEDFERGLFSDEDDRIALDAASVDELMEVLSDFLPDCWDPMIHRGYAAPDYCEFPEKDVCGTCEAKGKRPPRYRPLRP
jgi:hypothetical protein